MDIDHPTRKPVQQRSFEDAHETGQNEKLDTGFFQGGQIGGFGNLIQFGAESTGRNEARWNVPIASMDEYGRGLDIANHQSNVDGEDPTSNRLGKCDKVAASSRTQDGDP